MALPTTVPPKIQEIMLRLRDNPRFDREAPEEVRQMFSRYLGEQDYPINKASSWLERKFTIGQSDKFAPTETNILGDFTRLGAGVRNMFTGGRDTGDQGGPLDNFTTGFSRPRDVQYFSETEGDDMTFAQHEMDSFNRLQSGQGSIADVLTVIPSVMKSFGQTTVGFGKDILSDPLSYTPVGLFKNVPELEKAGEMLNKIPLIKKLNTPIGRAGVPKPSAIDEAGRLIDEGIPVVNTPIESPINPVAEEVPIGNPISKPVAQPTSTEDQLRFSRQAQRISRLKGAPNAPAEPQQVLPQATQPIPAANPIVQEPLVQHPTVAKPKAKVKRPALKPFLENPIEAPQVATGNPIEQGPAVSPIEDIVSPQKPVGGSRRVSKTTKIINRDELRSNKDTIYLFGDNLMQKGYGGQAAAMRGEPNAIGIPTKKKPTMNSDAFFTDAEFDSNVKAIDKAFSNIPAGKDIIVPPLGAGRAELKTRAPRTFEYLQSKIKELSDLSSPTNAQTPAIEDIIPQEKPLDVFHISDDTGKVNQSSKAIEAAKASEAARAAKVAKMKIEVDALKKRAVKLRSEDKLLDAVDVERRISAINSRIIDLGGKGEGVISLPVKEEPTNPIGKGPKSVRERFNDSLREFGINPEDEPAAAKPPAAKPPAKKKIGKLSDERGSIEFTRKKTRRDFVKKNLGAIREAATKKGIRFEDALARIKDESGQPLLNKMEIEQAVKGFLSPPETAPLNKGDFVRVAKSGETGEVVDRTGTHVNVKFDRGLAKYTHEQARKELRVEPKSDTLEPFDKLTGAKPVNLSKVTSKNPELDKHTAVVNDFLKEVYKPDGNINPQQIEKVSSFIADKAIEEAFPFEEVKAILGSEKLTLEQLVKTLREEASKSGQTLNVYSQTMKKIRAAWGDIPEVAALLGRGDTDSTTLLKLGKMLKKADSLYQTMLTTLWRTSVRNFDASQLHMGIDLMAELGKGAIQRFTGTGLRGQEYTNAKRSYEVWTQTFKKLGQAVIRKATRQISNDPDYATFKKIMDIFPFERWHMTDPFSTSGMTPANKLMKGLAYPNYAQERFVRREAFYGKVLGELEKQGRVVKSFGQMTADDLAFLKQNPQIVKDAVEHALKISAANMPETKWLSELVKNIQKVPGSGFVIPFVRFAAWAGEWSARYSPLPLFRLMEKDFRQRLLSVDNDKEAKILSQAFVGTSLFSVAGFIRESKLAGGHYYQIRVGSQKNGDPIYMDARLYSPYLAPYLFMYEATKNAFKSATGKVWSKKKQTHFSDTDWVEGLIGVRKVTGSPLALVDAFKQWQEGTEQSEENYKKLMAGIGGQVASGYFNFFKNLSDVYSLVDPEEAYSRSVKEEPFLGPIKDKLPKISQSLPRLSTMTQGEEPPKKGIASSFVSGIIPQLPTQLEDEINRLGIYLNPKTGNAKADRLIMKTAGKWMGEEGKRLINSNYYKSLNDEERSVAIKAVAEHLRDAYKKQHIQEFGTMMNDKLWREKQRSLLKRTISRMVDAHTYP